MRDFGFTKIKYEINETKNIIIETRYALCTNLMKYTIVGMKYATTVLKLIRLVPVNPGPFFFDLEGL